MSCFISFSICAFFYACLIQNADAYVMGIDMGSEFIKIAAIRPRIGVDVVLNEQSRRKTFQFVGFRGEDRYIGEDAKNLAPRFPQNMISMLNRLIGIAYDDVQTREWYTQELMHTYELLENERRKTIDIHLRKNPNQTFDIETLMGIIFSYIRQITKEHNDGIEIMDAVLIIPSFFTSRQRTALLDAAQLGGIKILGMMHTTTAIALQYGIQNRGFTNPVDIIIYDMGTSSTEVGLYTITPPPKGAKKSDSLGTITTRHIVSDPFLGGRNFDACLARKVASGIQNVDILSNLSSETGEKHAVILMRAANKAREVLSANKFTPVTFEGVLPNQMDYTAKVTREEFESWCGSYFERAMGLARRALEAMTTPPESLHAFEIHGGAVRMPKFQEDMHALLSRPVNRTLNGDESAALGAAYYAARLSGSFVVRGFAIHEAHPQNITFSLSPKVDLVESKSSHEDGEVHEEVVTRALFVNATLPRRRSITVTRTENFNVTLFSNDEWDRELHVTDLHATLSDMGFHSSEKDANNTHSVRLEMRLNESGLIEMNQAIAKYNEWVNVTKKVKVPVESKEKEDKIDGLNSNAEATEISSNEPEIPVEKEEDKSPEPSSESDSSTTNNESDSSNENSTNNEASNQDENHTSSSDDASKQASIENKIEPKFEYRTVSEKKQKHHQKNLQVDIVYRNPQPMNKTEYQSALKMLKNMSDREKLKHETAAAKNDLETLIIGVLTDYLDQFEKYITVEETERIQSVARVAREWLEDGDGMSEHTTKEQFLEQLGRIHAELKPVVDKKKEHLDSIEKARKEAIQKAIEIERAKRAAEKEAERRRKEESQNQTNPPEASDLPDQSDKPDHEDHVQADAETKDSAGESPEEL